MFILINVLIQLFIILLPLFIWTGVLDVKLLKPETPEYKEFEKEVRKRTAEPPFNYVIPEDEEVSMT